MTYAHFQINIVVDIKWKIAETIFNRIFNFCACTSYSFEINFNFLSVNQYFKINSKKSFRQWNEWGWTAWNLIARQSFARHFWQEINCSTQNLSTARIQLILAKLDSSKWPKKCRAVDTQFFATVKCKSSIFVI